MDISGSSAFQVGDGNTQNNFYLSPWSDPQPVASWWSDTWIPFTEPPLTAEIVLAGRQEAAATLRAVLTGDQRVLAVKGVRSVMEMKAFLAAALDGNPLSERAVFVADPAGLSVVLRETDSRIVLLDAGITLTGLPLAGPHTFVIYGREAVHPVLTVPAVDDDAVAQLLVDAGMEPQRARRCGGLARRGLEQLRHELSRYPQLPEAAWAVSPDRVGRRLSLLGEFTRADAQLLEGFTGVPYADLPDRAGPLLTDPDLPLLGTLNGHWYLQAPENAVQLLVKSYTEDDLTDLAELAVQVLTSQGTYSDVLRRGIARTLVLLSLHGANLRYGPSSARVTDLAHRVVRRILDGASPADWAGLTGVIELVAEAAPSAFLDGLSQAPDWYVAMFSSDRFYPPVLWALEILARPAEHFDDAVDILAGLAAVDPGGHLSNRPAASLAGIFDCGYPQTQASRKMRLRALQRLLKTHPGVARALLQELLPDGGATRLVHPQPQQRDWPIPQGSAPDDAYQAYRDVAALAIEDARSDPGRCAQLIPRINAMPSEERAAFSTLLANLTVTDALVRRRLFEALNELVVRHRQVADEPWALAGQEIDELARIAETFTPDRAVDRHRSLFAERWPHYWHHNPGWDIELAQARADAVQEILDEDGIEALFALADETLNGDLIGAALPEQADDTQLMSRLTGEQPTLAFEYFAVRMREAGHSKRQDLLERANTPEQRALILLAGRDPHWAWGQLKDLDGPTSDAYWRRFPIGGLGQDFDGVAEAAAGLNSVSRFAAALHLIMIYANRSESDRIAHETAIACEGFIGSRGMDPGDGVVVSKYDLQVIVSLLARYQDVIGRRRVVDIELGLSSRMSGLNLSLPATSALLEEDPGFYAELVVAELRGESRDAQTAAYRAIRAFTSCPGTRADGSLDAQTLRVWVDKVREHLAAEDLQKLGDEVIAKILVHALPSSLEKIGELLEDVRSKDLDQGMWMALYNRRGLTSRGLTDGGTQELTLADEYEQLALQAQDAPRLQRILRSLAEKYRNEGANQDDEAEGVRRRIF